MSTRCQIKFYDRSSDKYYLGAMLYHHCDGYPDFMKENLQTFLDAAYRFLIEDGHGYWWDAERVASIIVVLSSTGYSYPNEYEKQQVPSFQVSQNEHSDIEYMWHVYLLEEGKYEIKYNEV